MSSVRFAGASSSGVLLGMLGSIVLLLLFGVGLLTVYVWKQRLGPVPDATEGQLAMDTKSRDPPASLVANSSTGKDTGHPRATPSRVAKSRGASHTGSKARGKGSVPFGSNSLHGVMRQLEQEAQEKLLAAAKTPTLPQQAQDQVVQDSSNTPASDLATHVPAQAVAEPEQQQQQPSVEQQQHHSSPQRQQKQHQVPDGGTAEGQHGKSRLGAQGSLLDPGIDSSTQSFDLASHDARHAGHVRRRQVVDGKIMVGRLQVR